MSKPVQKRRIWWSYTFALRNDFFAPEKPDTLFSDYVCSADEQHALRFAHEEVQRYFGSYTDRTLVHLRPDLEFTETIEGTVPNREKWEAWLAQEERTTTNG